MSTFEKLGLIEPIQRALSARDYTTPTPIQSQAIPLLLQGRDILGCAQTGTGKTAAFTLPVLQKISAQPSSVRGRRPVRALVLTPTRELAAQIGDSVEAYGRYLHVRHGVIFGGVKQHAQTRMLERGIDILIATPGRLLDLIDQGFVDLSQVDFFVLDEADRMLDMGFIHDVRRVLALLPRERQNLLFSATMPPTIVELAGSFLRNPAQVEVTPQASTVDKVRQTVMFCERTTKGQLLAWLIRQQDVESAIVFTRTKHGANRLVKVLDREGIPSAAIHGNKSQGARTRALDGFRNGEIPILVATDIASRGIDVDGVSHVFNYDLPNESESYVHRIGRTARAGREGVAIAFCDETEGEYLRDIERLIGMSIPIDTDHQWHYERAIPPMRIPRGRGGSARPATRSDRPGGGPAEGTRGRSRRGGRGGSGPSRAGSPSRESGEAGGPSRGRRRGPRR